MTSRTSPFVRDLGVTRSPSTYPLKTWEKVALIVCVVAMIIGVLGLGAGLEGATFGTFGGGALFLVSLICPLVILVRHYYNQFSPEMEIARQFKKREEPLSEEIRSKFVQISEQQLSTYMEKHHISSESDKIATVKYYLRARASDQLPQVLEKVGLKLSSLAISSKVELLKIFVIDHPPRDIPALKDALLLFHLPTDTRAMRALSLALMKFYARERENLAPGFAMEVLLANPPLFEKKELFKSVYETGSFYQKKDREAFFKFLVENWKLGESIDNASKFLELLSFHQYAPDFCSNKIKQLRIEGQELLSIHNSARLKELIEKASLVEGVLYLGPYHSQYYEKLFPLLDTLPIGQVGRANLMIELLEKESAQPIEMALGTLKKCKELEGTPGEFDAIDLKAIYQAVQRVLSSRELSKWQEARMHHILAFWHKMEEIL